MNTMFYIVMTLTGFHSRKWTATLHSCQLCRYTQPMGTIYTEPSQRRYRCTMDWTCWSLELLEGCAPLRMAHLLANVLKAELRSQPQGAHGGHPSSMMIERILPRSPRLEYTTSAAVLVTFQLWPPVIERESSEHATRTEAKHLI